MGCVGKIILVLFVASLAWAERVQLKPREAFQASSGNSTRNSRELLQASLPFLETYWESYLSWPFDYDSCGTGVPTFQ